jgi:hypothetical protein
MGETLAEEVERVLHEAKIEIDVVIPVRLYCHPVASVSDCLYCTVGARYKSGRSSGISSTIEAPLS